jgi:uncharacterized protein (DUF2252 family)
MTTATGATALEAGRETSPWPALSPQERADRGRAARREVPRSAHAVLDLPADRRSPVDILEDESADRLAELVPVRYGRMLESPFAFYRGAAAIMAADLAPTPVSGLHAQLCGDAHIANFGAFASPDRDLVFDINDFDETAHGPWEWDVKRLSASVAIAGREIGLKRAARGEAVRSGVRAYREAIREFGAMSNLAGWYARMEVAEVRALVDEQIGARQAKQIDKAMQKARGKDSLKALSKLTCLKDGELRFQSRPPLLVPIDELLPGAADRALVEGATRQLIGTYAESLRSDRRHLLSGYRFVDMARKVVGVGSVGTRAWVVLLEGRDGHDPLVMQVKEAGASVLEPFLGADPTPNHGQRVVQGHWLMQASSDILLGWLRTPGADGVVRDFYVRQLWDWKLSADIERMVAKGLTAYAGLCGWTLARAHARSGDRIAIGAYLGAGDAFDRALAEFAEAYADRNEADYGALAEAARTGRIVVERGV